MTNLWRKKQRKYYELEESYLFSNLLMRVRILRKNVKSSRFPKPHITNGRKDINREEKKPYTEKNQSPGLIRISLPKKLLKRYWIRTSEPLLVMQLNAGRIILV